MADDSEFPESDGCIMDSRSDQEVPSAKAHIACTDPTHVDMVDTLVKKPPGAVLTRCCTGCGLIGRVCDCSRPAVYRWFGIAKRTQRCSRLGDGRSSARKRIRKAVDCCCLMKRRSKLKKELKQVNMGLAQEERR